MAKRYTLTIFLFFGFAFSVFYLAEYVINVEFEDKVSLEKKLQKRDEVSTFENIQYFKLSPEGQEVEMNAHVLSIYQEKKYEFSFPEGVYLNKEQKIFRYRAFSAAFLRGENRVDLEGDVVIESLESVIKSDKASYFISDQYFELKENVKSTTKNLETGDKITVTSLRAKGWPAQNRLKYLGNVQGDIKRRRVYERGVSFGSNEISIDLNTNQIDLRGDVALKKQQLTANSLRGEIFLRNYNKKLKYYALYDDVRIVERLPKTANGVQIRRAFAESLEGSVKDKTIVLKGTPRVIQGDSIIEGNQITLFENTQVVEVDDSTSSLYLKDTE